MRLIALSLLTVLASSCDYRTCELVGCSSAITLILPARQTEPYRVAVQSDVVSGSVECAPSDQIEDSRWVGRDFNGDLRADIPAIATVECEADRATIRFFSREPSLPDAIVVEVDADVELSRNFTDLEYEVFQPNGPECEPTCRTVALPLAP